MNIVKIIGAVVSCCAFCKIALQSLKILTLRNRYKSGKIEYEDTYGIKLSRMQEMIPIYGFALLVGIIIYSIGIVLT